MPRKINFTLVHATSESGKYRATELNSHGPTVRGWQSGKNGDFPQEITLQLECRSVLYKIQVLAHQYLIPEKVELWTSNDDVHETELPEQWDYLGYITLSDNQSTGFKSRELKSVSVPECTASFLKLKLGKNHDNAYNIHNQVSLIAVNVLGNYAEERNVEKNSISDKLLEIVDNPQYTSPYDDLAFEMYVDSDVANIIREMEFKKHQAVLNERFEYASKLKVAMENLRQAGEKLGKYELEKRHAIELEDYEKASRKKNQMDDFRKQAYQQCTVEQLLEANGISSKNDECVDQADSNKYSNGVSSPQALLKVPAGKESASNVHSSNSPLHHTGPKSPNTGSPTNVANNGHQRSGSFRRRNKSAGAIAKQTYEDYEERTLPALRHSQTNEFLRECQMEADMKMVSKLSEREKKQAALPILVFGNDIVEKFYSKHYCDKEDGLNKLKEELRSFDNTKMHTANKTARAAIFLLHRALRDKVFSVYSLANEVIRMFFVEFVPGRVTQAEVARSVDKLLPELLTKSGDTVARIHHMAVHTILTMADCRNVRELHQIPVHITRPVSSSTHPRLALSRMEMVEQLILNHGISTDKQSGLTCRILSEFGTSGLHHPAEAVRKVAERVLVHVYKVNPRLVRKQLPPDDDITRRNLLYRQLFHEFDKIDIQRKKDILERNRLIQQCSTVTNPECTSPDPVNFYHTSIESSVLSGSPITQKRVTDEVVPQNGINGLQKNTEADKPTNGFENRHSSSSASGISSPSGLSHNEEDENFKQCIFCLSRKQGLSNDDLNVHYWRWCPMLVRCNECGQVVEVAALNEHLLDECEKQNAYTQCSKCMETIPQSCYENHIVNECKEVADGCQRCPLCHEDIDSSEMGWRNHLMGDHPCPKNLRVKGCQKQVTIQT